VPICQSFSAKEEQAKIPKRDLEDSYYLTRGVKLQGLLYQFIWKWCMIKYPGW